MKHILDLDTWPRRDHFRFFSRFEEPFFGLCTEVDCTAAYQAARQHGHSFFLHYLYHALAAANRTEPFRYRIEGSGVVVHDTLDASATINRPDGTFGFSYLRWADTFAAFSTAASIEMEAVRQGTGLVPATAGENVIHFSSLPWVRFTGLSHARAFSFADSIPKISFGKMTETAGRHTMPVSIHVHHGLMDGLHVAQYLDCLQHLLDQPA